jgi:ribulose-phosphate 3-epimerase
MSILVPSILENTKEKFLITYQKEIKLPGVNRIQVDFGDGKFVPNTILPISEIDVLDETIHWEAHLMIQEPMDFLDYKISGFKTIIIHYEAYQNEEAVKQAIKVIKDTGLLPALCIKNETPVTVLEGFFSEVKHFQLMSVVPGFQGTSFLENTYERILLLRKLNKYAIIEVDGGINETNIEKVAKAGADLIILGAVITKVENMQVTWENLNKKINIKLD